VLRLPVQVDEQLADLFDEGDANDPPIDARQIAPVGAQLPGEDELVRLVEKLFSFEDGEQSRR
jgi:hypothetical protein